MTRSIVLIGVLSLSGCTRDVPATRLEVSAGVLATCTRVSGLEIGALPLDIEVGGKLVRLAEWTTADAVTTDVVGFAAQLPPDVVFTVEAGDRTFHGDQPRWLHPLGVSGPRVHGIDALTFCTVGVQPALALAP